MFRFQSDDRSAAATIALFQDYKNFGGPLMSTGDRSRTFHYKSVTYEPLAELLVRIASSCQGAAEMMGRRSAVEFFTRLPECPRNF